MEEADTTKKRWKSYMDGGEASYIHHRKTYGEIYVKAKPLTYTTGKNMEKFEWDQVVYSHSVYHSQANRQVEVTNKDIIEGIEMRLGRSHQGWV
ncbi:hypothetical protein Tco_1442519 [Tanacetum coccineum]